MRRWRFWLLHAIVGVIHSDLTVQRHHVEPPLVVNAHFTFADGGVRRILHLHEKCAETGVLGREDLQEQVQFRQPCFVHTPQACSRLFRKACRARWSRTVAFVVEMRSVLATSAVDSPPKSIRRINSLYAGRSVPTTSSRHAQIVAWTSSRDGTSCCWRIAASVSYVFRRES